MDLPELQSYERYVGADLRVRPDYISAPGRTSWPTIPGSITGYDYSQDGAYFLTLVTQDRAHRFGEIIEQQMILNRPGQIMLDWWTELPTKFPSISLGAHVLMPNHLHGVIAIQNRDEPDLRQTPRSAPTISGQRLHAAIPQIVQWFKTMTTNSYIRGVRESGWLPFNGRLWQRGYYEHVVRNAGDYERIYDYIECNPARWSEDKENSPLI